jgi:peptidoglycan/LPS O-acetylase OafA/YrhL
MSHADFRATRVFTSLNGLRCLSILAVIWHHAAGGAFALPLAGRGYFGVTLFFVISGFLITTLLLRERASYGDISLSGFYARRTLRIFPLYYTVILLYLALVLVVERESAAGHGFLHHNVVHYATYSANWFVPLHDERVIFYFAWSLAAEEQFYLVWPSVERYVRGHWPVALAGALIAVPLFATTPAGHAVFGAHGGAQTVLASIPAGICLGVLLAHLLHAERGYRVAAALLGPRWASPALLVAAAAALAFVPVSGPVGVLAVTAVLALLVGACVVREDHGLRGLLTWRPVGWLGVVSYGMYLLHMLAMNAAGRALDRVGLNTPVMLFILSVAVVAAAATVSYRWYESYFLRLRARYRRSTVDGAAPARGTAEPAPAVGQNVIAPGGAGPVSGMT